MYRTGFGDCFLLTLQSGRRQFNALIDFGVHTRGNLHTLESIMDDIEVQTSRRLDLVIASHAHQDHISAFGTFQSRFANFKIDEVWLPWTEDPRNRKANLLRQKQNIVFENLHSEVESMLKMRGVRPELRTAFNILMNLRENEKALRALATAFGTNGTVRYLRQGYRRSGMGGNEGLMVRVLGPPDDDLFLARMDPPVSQRYLAPPNEPTEKIRPFADHEVRRTGKDWENFSRDCPVLTKREEKELGAFVQSQTESLAFAMDSIRNNTSLVVLFLFKGKSLLFPGDAQWGSWQFMMQDAEVQHILSELDFLKVSHHGSRNATPRQFIASLKSEKLNAVIPTQVEPFPTIPRKPLIEALAQRCCSRIVVRSDHVRIANAPNEPAPEMPRGFTIGKCWIDYDLDADKNGDAITGKSSR